jgi:DNA-directed RNA polymerase subunit M/transcription elongation factor TFIIS
MQSTANEPSALMFTCERCGHWPMAYQGDDTARRVSRFVCPKCHAHAGFNARAASRMLSAVGEFGSSAAG